MQSLGKTGNGYELIAIGPGEESPMANHLGGEIAVDDDAKRFYAWHVFVVTYGLDSIIAACNKYAA